MKKLKVHWYQMRVDDIDYRVVKATTPLGERKCCQQCAFNNDCLANRLDCYCDEIIPKHTVLRLIKHRK